MLRGECQGLQLDAVSPAQAITEQAEKLWVLKAGRIVARSTRSSEIMLPPMPE